MTAPAMRVRRKVQHALFAYEGPDGLQAVGHRGAIVELLPADLARAEKFDAVIGENDELDRPTTTTWDESVKAAGFNVPGGYMPPFADADGPMEQRAWVASATVDEVLAEVRKSPGIVNAVLVAEQASGRGRGDLLLALARFATDGMRH